MDDETLGARQIREYRLSRRAGAGGFGDVWEAENTETGLECAFKQIALDHYEEERVQEALYAVQSAQNTQHVVGVLNFFPHVTDDGRRTFCIVTELIRHGHLGEFIERKKVEGAWPLPLSEAVQIALGIARGMAAIHGMRAGGDGPAGGDSSGERICHLDLKPSNIMMDRKDEQDIPRITDFGLARSAESLYVGGGCTPGYAAPEQMNVRQEKGQHSDRFSFGMILHELLTGQPAVTLREPVSRREARLREYAEWTAAERQPPAPSAVRAELRRCPALDDLVSSLLKFDPEARKRITTTSVVQKLQAVLAEIKAGIEPSLKHAKPEAPKVRYPDDASYIEGAIPLPFECVAVKILHDQRTAIVGGVDGRIAAIDLRTGDVLGTTAAEDSTRARPGGGENHYVGNSYFFLELAPVRQCFYTMSHSAELKMWAFDGGFRLVSSTPLLAPHFDVLRSEILKVKDGGWRTGRWSGWTCYSRDVPEDIPSGIVDAKFSPDKSSVLCLTEWFAIFRCDLAGRLCDKPRVIGDVFAIEPGNADGSEFWAGSSTWGGDALFRTGFRNRDYAGNSWRGGSFGDQGIHSLTNKVILAGGVAVDLQALTRVESSDLWLGRGLRPLVLPKQRCVLAPGGSMIHTYDLETLRSQGDSFVAGHDGDVRALDSTSDESHLVSTDARTLRVWDIRTRTPLGGHPPSDSFLRIGIAAVDGPHFRTRDGKVCCLRHKTAAVIDMGGRSVTSVQSSAGAIGAVGDSGEVQVFEVGTTEGRPFTGAKGLLARALKIAPPEAYLLFQKAVSSGANPKCESVELKLLRSTSLWVEFTHDIQKSAATDLGDGRVALLIAGHLAIYDTGNRAVAAGPLEISRPSDDSAEWRYYSQLAASPDGTKVFVRGHDCLIKVFDSVSLKGLGEIPGTAGEIGILLPLGDSQHVIYSSKSSGGHHLHVADSSSRSVVGTLCKLPSSPSENYWRSALLGGGTMLAMTNYSGSIRLLNLLTGKHDDEPIAVHADSVVSIHLCPNEEELLTISADGSARYWSLRGRVPNVPDPVAALVAAAKRVDG